MLRTIITVSFAALILMIWKTEIPQTDTKTVDV